MVASRADTNLPSILHKVKLPALLRRQGPRPSLAALESAEPPQRDGRRILLRFCHARNAKGKR
jgi:hypothetical protein